MTTDPYYWGFIFFMVLIILVLANTGKKGR
jgi:hypothetical protein